MGSCRTWVWVVLLVGLAGCHRTPPPTPDTGAKHALQEYGDAVVHRDWTKAYDTLHPESRQKWTREQFARSAEAYRRKFGFEPEKFLIRSCEEQETQAIARVAFLGHSPSKHQRYTDGVVLRQSPDGWRVVLQPNFGK